MKNLIFTVCVASMLTACTEKSAIALKVFRDKAEDAMIEQAGEPEVVLELSMKQYAALRGRLVKIRALHAMYSENLDRAYAANDPRRVGMYEKHVKYLQDSIPRAEAGLKEYYDYHQQLKIELQLLKEEIAVHSAVGDVPATPGVMSTYERRAESISKLIESLRLKSKMIEANTSVAANLEESLIR